MWVTWRITMPKSIKHFVKIDHTAVLFQACIYSQRDEKAPQFSSIWHTILQIYCEVRGNNL